MNNFECPLCGEEHPEGARFCPVTGQSLEYLGDKTQEDLEHVDVGEAPRTIAASPPSFLTEVSPVTLDLEGWMLDETLARALEGLVSRSRSGQPRQLIDLLTQEPDNAAAWVWLAREARADVEKRACLQKALQLEPDHAAARLAWASLEPAPLVEDVEIPEWDEAVEPEGETDLAAKAINNEELPEEQLLARATPEEPFVQIVTDADEKTDSVTSEPGERSGGGRVFEPLIETEFQEFESDEQYEPDPPIDLPKPEWQMNIQQDGPVESWSGSADLTHEPTGVRRRRRMSTSEVLTIVVLVLLLVTNIWTAVSIIRLNRTVSSLEVQAAETHTLVTTFQEMMLDLVVRMDIISQPGP